MAARNGLDIAAVLVLHLVADTRAAMIRRDGPDSDGDSDIDIDDPTAAPTITVTATATANPTGNAAVASTSSGNSTTSSTGAASSSGSHLDQGVKAGIAIGAIVGGFFVAGVIFMIVRRWRRNQRAKRLPPHDQNNPHLLTAKNIGPSGGGGFEDKRSHVSTTSSREGSNRPWFDTGVGGTELEAGTGGRGRRDISSWVLEKAELATPHPGSPLADGSRRGDRAAELPDARGTRFEPVELPAAMPLMPRDRDEDEEPDRLGTMGTWKQSGEGTWGTGTMSSFNSGTFVSSPTLTDESSQGMVSPCSTGSGSHQMGKPRV